MRNVIATFVLVLIGSVFYVSANSAPAHETMFGFWFWFRLLSPFLTPVLLIITGIAALCMFKASCKPNNATANADMQSRISSLQVEVSDLRAQVSDLNASIRRLIDRMDHK